MKNPVIVVVAYRRLNTLQRLLSSISKAIYRTDSITLLISIDYHSENGDIIQYAENFIWEHGSKIIKTHQENLGLRNHIIECGNYSIQFGSIILLEDDEIVAPMFYEYAKSAQKYYSTDNRIAGVSLYGREWNDYECNRFQPLLDNGDVYFGQFSCTRGQSWSAAQWKRFMSWYMDHDIFVKDDKLPPPVYSWNESWGKYFLRYMVESNCYYVIPYKPVSTVYGEIGTHSSKKELDVQNALYWGNQEYHFIDFDLGQRYDVFYENDKLRELLAERFQLDENEICIDIYGLRGRKYGSKRYVLTTRKMGRKVITQFDLSLRPHELNVILEIPGDEIILYDYAIRDKRGAIYNKGRLNYDLAGYRGTEAFNYACIHTFEVILSIIKR